MSKGFRRPKLYTGKPMHYCPGCTHGIIHRLIAEVIEELGVEERTIGVGSVGCSVFIYDYLDLDFIQAAHGRASAVATGVKRARPDALVFTYQGDGDLAAIGTAEIVHCAVRGEKITVFFINNAIYGMTGGQMAPTTIAGQKTTTTPFGRDVTTAGYPIRMTEMLATQEGTAYAARVSVHDPRHVLAAKKAVRRAFLTQQQGLGFSIVEFLSACPTNWGMPPRDALKWLAENMIPTFPLGEIKKPEGVE
ncbi:MAG: 2-oxoglutarate/2-oxoacid ferredoxin oxidoreductase subunit beta [Eubacteriales bacterium]|nr:2-oxoglutarate/2-oxoacid ferredoxin oxidoreductase subunit beta [Eubacteriales bacterium]